MSIDTTRVIIYDWSIKTNKNKTIMILVTLSMLALLAITILMSPIADPMITEIGLGVYTLIWLSLVLGVTIIHEGLHGLFFWLFSRHVSFGVKWKTKFGPAPYATSNGQMFTKRQYQMIGFAPQFLTALLLILGVLFHAPISAIIVMAAAANLAGGCVDMWAIYEIQRLPENILVEDTADGFRVWRDASV